MKKKCLAIILGIVTCIMTLTGCGQQPQDTQESRDGRQSVIGTIEPLAATGDPVELVLNQDVTYDSLNHFSYELFRESIQNSDGKNPVISPISAYVAMAMAGAGAQKDTLQEFYDIMGQDFLSVADKALQYYPTEQEKLKVLLANSVWIDSRLEVGNSWLSCMGQVFAGEVYQMDRLYTKDAMNQINNWASDHTDGMIDPFLNKPLSQDTYLALINALYFDGEWRSPFQAESTHDRTFTMDDGTEQKIPMMSKYRENFIYYEDDTCYGVLLNYRDGNYAFMALLPKESGDIRSFASKVDAARIRNLLDNSGKEKCNVRLPKLDINYEITMNDSLINLGFAKAFDDHQADFSGIGVPTDTKNPLYIANVLQKVAVKLDEKGTQAAAVTMVELQAKSECIMEEERVIDVFYDRPFVYSIIDTQTHIPLFMGIMEEPN